MKKCAKVTIEAMGYSLAGLIVGLILMQFCNLFY